MKFLLATLLSTLFISVATQADSVSEQAFKLIPEVKEWMNSDIVVDSIKEQNKRHAQIQENEILALDQEWRKEVKSESKPMIDKILANKLSKYLASVKVAGEGKYTEIFVMDNKGLNVGQSDVTSDYWQGDEDKWQKTYLVGPDSTHVSDVEFDKSANKYQSQLSLPIVDKETGNVIGAITIGIYVNALLK